MDDLTFLDLAVLRRIDDDTVVERFGTKINTSFFESANLLGTMKVKGLIEFESVVGGLSKVNLTENGRHTLKRATEKAQEDMDSLDSAIVSAIANGVSDPERLAVKLSVNSQGIAFHLDKLVYNNYVDYMIRNARVTLSLTEAGFNLVGNAKGEIKAGEEKAEAGPAKEAAPAKPASQPIQPSPKQEALGLLAPAKKDDSAEDAKELVSDGGGPANVKVERIKSKAEYYLARAMPFIVLLLIIVLAAIAYLVLTAGA